MKKAQVAPRYLIEIMIAIMLTLVGLIVIKVAFGGMLTSIKESECEKSVLSHVKMVKINKLASKTSEQVQPIECPTIELKLRQKKEEEIKYAIAEKMRICWKNWQAGEKELFLEDSTYCHPCYLIDFKYDNIEIKDFDKFLIKTYIKGENYTYMQYFSGYTNNEQFSAKELEKNPEIQNNIGSSFKTNSTKVILFYHLSDNDEIKERMKDLEAIAKGAATGAIAGGIIVGGVAGTICGLATFGTTAAACAAGGAKAGAALGAIAGGFIAGEFSADYPRWISYIMLKDYNNQTFSELGCKIAPGKQTNLYNN